MKTVLAVLLTAAVALADPPKAAPKTFPAGDGCNTCTDAGGGFATCTLLACNVKMPAVLVGMGDPPGDAPLADVPDVSVRLAMGQPAPFAGRLLSPEENVRRAKRTADCEATLADAEGNGVLLPRPAVAALISGAAAAVVTSIVLGVALASKK
jgi:hypothetical protein